jgi:hypothetical protein
MNAGTRSRTFGILLVAGACIGFATVADDLRHTGELFGVGALLVCGLALLTGRPALRWVAIGTGGGFAVGMIIGHMAAGVGGGALIGMLGAVTLPPLSFHQLPRDRTRASAR